MPPRGREKQRGGAMFGIKKGKCYVKSVILLSNHAYCGAANHHAILSVPLLSSDFLMSPLRRFLPLLAVLSSLAPAHAQTFSNSNPIAIPVRDSSLAKASPYPAQITVSGVVGEIADLNVSLSGYSHSAPGEVDVLLVGPSGQKVVVLSDVGGVSSSASNLSLFFDDEATRSFEGDPNNPFAPLSGGTYKPSNVDDGRADSFPAPAPAAPFAAALSSFDATNPNGTWKLFVVDDSGSEDGGNFSGGWSLTMTLRDPTGAGAFVVTTLDDTANANDGLISLREAINSANNDPANNAITFAESVFGGARKTITLGGSQLTPIFNAGTLSIQAPASGVTISGNNTSRVFFVRASAVASFVGLTITRGNAGQDAFSGFGGGIYNLGILTLDSCTVRDSSAAQGGGIYSTASVGNSLTIRNSTLSGNSAGGVGGGLYNANGLTRIESSTITNNQAANNGGWGVASAGNGGTGVRTEVSNSIITANQNPDGSGDVEFVGGPTNSFQSNGFNLVNNGNALAAFNAASDLTGPRTLGLAPLAENGGPTPTHALLVGSPARDSGSTPLTLDQRGVERPQPFDGQDDRGAFENNVFAESLVVTTLTDEDNYTSDPSYGTGTSLREAIKRANSDGVDSVITFGAAAFGEERVTIVLRGEILPLIEENGSLSITAPALGVVIAGNQSSGIFETASGSVVTLKGLSLIGGAADSGGAVRNTGTLLVDSCTLNGNTARVGGALYSEGDPNGGAMTVRNSTLSGNEAGEAGGAIYAAIGLTRIESSTIAGNSAPTDSGAGLATPGDMFTPVNVVVQNSIISGNSGTDVDYLFGNRDSDNVQSEGNNLIGAGNATGFFYEGGDVSGNSDPGLAPLGENGGPTQTRALLSGSPAFNTGNTALSVDQRGLRRPQGAGDDKGAFELESNDAPVTVSVTPVVGNSSPNTAYTLTATYSDADGAADISQVRLLVNATNNASGALYGWYNRATNRLSLVNDTNTAPIGSFAPGSANVITNSQGSLNCAATTVTVSGNSLTVKWSFTPNASFTGTKNVYAYVRDVSNVVAPLTDLADWTIGNAAPQSVSVTPGVSSSNRGVAHNLTATYSDANGAVDISQVRLLVNTSPNASNALYGWYDRAANKLYLVNNTNTALVGGFAPGSANVITNSQGSLNCAATTVAVSGNTLTVKWNFTPSFTGPKNVYGYAKDNLGAIAPLVDKADWTILGTSNPTVGSVTPLSGNSSVNMAYNLTATYSDGDGATDISQVRLLVNAVNNASGALYGYYNRDTNKLYLVNNTNTALVGGFAPGSANVITNSQGSLNCAATTVTVSGNTLTVKWSFTPNASFTGTKNVYGYVKDVGNAVAPLVDKADWTITSPASALKYSPKPSGGNS